MIDRSNLPTPHKGDYLTADQVSTVFDFVKNPPWANGGNFGGMSDPYGSAFFQKKSPNYRLQIDAKQDFQRNSVFLLGGAAGGSISGPEPVQDWPTSRWLGLRQHKGNTNPNYATTNMHRFFATNESSDIVSGTTGWATLIQNQPVKVLADPYYPPVPFWPCGPEQGKATVSCRSAGLMALSNVDDYGLVEVVAHTPRFFFAVSTSLLSMPDTTYISPTTCTVDVMFPKPVTETASWPDELEVSKDAAFLGLTVANHDTTLEVPNDTFGHIVFEWGRWFFVWTAC